MIDEALKEAAARNVMGWHKAVHEKSDMVFWVNDLGVGQNTIEDYDPLEEIKDAWLLVEKIRGMPKELQDDFHWRLVLAHRRYEYECCKPGKVHDPDDPAENMSFTSWLTPRAITIAAVEAVGVGRT